MESAAGSAFQPPAAAERAVRIDGPAARHSAADSVRHPSRSNLTAVSMEACHASSETSFPP